MKTGHMEPPRLHPPHLSDGSERDGRTVMSDTALEGTAKFTTATIKLTSGRTFAWPCRERQWATPSRPSKEVSMAKRHCRPSSQYRYEHYDPKLAGIYR
jgi:hypothetical protein